MTINILKDEPLILTVDEADAAGLDAVDAGAAFTEYLHAQVGEFDTHPLGDYVDIVSSSVNPKSAKFKEQVFEYVDLREVDEVYGQILKTRQAKGAEIGSNKHRFQKWDILFAKIMPSLANKKIALVSQDVSNALASSEFVVLRLKEDAGINLFYLFRALRSDHFTRQAVANVTGATGRQRIAPRKLLEYQVIVPPEELQNQIGEAVEKEFSLRTLAMEQSKLADDLSKRALGDTRLRTQIKKRR